MAKSIIEMFVVEYSRSQNCFHVESVGEMLAKNRRMLLDGESIFTDYIPVALFATEQEASAEYYRLRKAVNEQGFSQETWDNIILP
ncbi:MAG: hypothetical protein H0V27_09590 [Pyrinomonadaceae bacterium]|nr:hypothetical protein [Pyrinomonadaceae bacterium]